MSDPPPLVDVPAEHGDGDLSAVPPWLTALIGVSGGVVFVLLLCLAVVLLRRSSPVVPAWAAHAVSEDTMRIVRVQWAKLPEHRLFRDVMRTLPPAVFRYPGGLEPEDLDDAFIVCARQWRRVVVWTRDDLPLEDFLLTPDQPLPFEGHAYGLVNFSELPEAYITQTGPRWFSLAATEGNMQDLLTRYDNKTAGIMDDVLTMAVRLLSSEDHYVAQLIGNHPVSANDVVGLGFGVSLGTDTIDVTCVFVFSSKEAARRFIDEYSTTIDSWSQQIAQQPPEAFSDAARQAMLDGLQLLRDERPHRQGNAVYIRGTWPIQEVERYVPALPEIADLFVGMPP